MNCFETDVDQTSPTAGFTHQFLHRLVDSKATWLFVGLLAILSCGGDVWYVFESGSIDLRNRVVGARLLVTGKDAYSYVWREGDPQTLLDPVTLYRSAPANRVTVAPSVLATYAIFSALHYRYQQFIWLVLQWMAMASAISIFVSCAKTPLDRRFLLLVLLLFYVAGDCWRLHVERGQVYIFYTLILAIAYVLVRRETCRGEWACGFVLGLGVVFRITFMLTAIPLIFSGRWRAVVGGAIGVLVGFVATLPFARIDDWQSYFTAMEAVGDFHLGVERRVSATNATPAFPESIEGMTNLLEARNFDSPSSELFVCSFVFPETSRQTIVKLFFVVLLAIFSWLLFRARAHVRGLDSCLFAGAFLFMAADFFMPVPRHGYYNVMWIVPLSMLIIREGSQAVVAGRRGAILFVGLAFSCGVVQAGALDPLGLSNFLVLGYFTVALLRLARLTPLRWPARRAS